MFYFSIAAWFLFLASSRWFGIRLDITSSFFLACVSFSTVMAASILDIESGPVGLILVYSMMLVGMFQWGIRQSTEIENMVGEM